MNTIQNIVLSPIIYNNQSLLIKRKKPPYQGFWSLPGGKIEFGEHPQEAVIREIQEETGLIVKTAALRAIVSEILISENSQKEHFFLWLYQTEVTTGKIQESEEGEIGLFSLSKILKQRSQIIPSDFAMIKFVLTKKKQIRFLKSIMELKGGRYILKYFGS